MSGSTSTVADVIPLIVCLRNSLQPSMTNSESDEEDNEIDHQRNLEIINFMKQTMKADIDKKFAALENENNLVRSFSTSHFSLSKCIFSFINAASFASAST